ncbi:MAG TPA: PorP/SprF family type IX secretion system membrane protein [Chitinophagaceae bacterium]
MRNLILCLLFLSCTILLKAQDPHFSQFFSSPLTLNPAFTGKFDGNVRVAGNYRNQWPTINRAYQTGTASVDFPILRKKIDYRDTWGVGIMAYTDKSAAGAVGFNYISLSTAFHKGFDEDGYKQLGLGLQTTYSNMNIYTADLKFEDQLTPLGFTGVTNETFGNSILKSSYFDVNAGLLYTTSRTDKDNLYAGVSVYHINRPKQNFTTNSFYLLNPRATFHAGGYFPTGETTTLHISALYSTQAKAHETLLGGAMQFMVADETVSENPVSFYAGSWIRLSDALIPYIGLEYNSFRFGLTYDINISDLKTASQSRGGVEVSLIYIARPAGSKGVPCPKF